MRNLEVRSFRHAHVPVAPGDKIVARCCRLSVLSDVRCMFFLRVSRHLRKVTLCCTSLDRQSTEAEGFKDLLAWTECDLSHFCASPEDSPVALEADPGGFDPVIVAMRSGAIISVQIDHPVPELVGEVVDDDSTHSGILTLARSPDGALIVVVSPVKIIVMSTTWELVRELDLGGVVALSASASWRGDGEAFVVIVQLASGVVQGCVVDRDGDRMVALDVSGLKTEAVKLGTAIAWEPRVGGIICLGGPGGSVSCFERNGLRHMRNDFLLRDERGLPVRDQIGREPPMALAWSCDSSMLALSISPNSSSGGSKCDAVAVYIRSNYEWKLKAFFPFSHPIADAQWDAEDPRSLHVLSVHGELQSYSFWSSHERSIGHVDGNAVGSVIDGARLLLTNLNKALIPPPMFHSCFVASGPISSVCSIDAGTGGEGRIGMLLSNWLFEICRSTAWDQAAGTCRLDASLARCDKNDGSPRSLWSLTSRTPSARIRGHLRMPMYISQNLLALVVSNEEPGKGESVVLFRLAEHDFVAEEVATYALDCFVMAARKTSSAIEGVYSEILLAVSSGRILTLRVSESGRLDQRPYSFSVENSFTCLSASDAVTIARLEAGSSRRPLTFVRNEHGVLEVLDTNQSRRAVLSRECSSFCVANGFLVYTTRSHVMYCVPLDFVSQVGGKMFPKEHTVVGLLDSTSHETDPVKVSDCSSQAAFMDVQAQAGCIRPIDRGSVIVTALPQDVRIVLQAPRGNLETVAPRPIVISRVIELALAKEYGSAFLLSRQQRIDMNVMVDADPEGFRENIGSFVEQVGNPGHLCIFITFLKGPVDKVNDVCGALVEVIDGLPDRERAFRYVSVVITAIHRCQPIDFTSLLKRVQLSHDRSAEEGANALDFLLVLAKNEELLYGEALGTYDLNLARMVARASQMDPAEYTTELHSLQNMDDHHRRHYIDMKLARYESALSSLFFCGDAEREACFVLTRKHNLFEHALRLFKADPDGLAQIRRDYASYLISEHRYSAAAAVCASSGDWVRAGAAYRDAGEWQLALSAISRASFHDMNARDALGSNLFIAKVYKEFAGTVADSLTEANRHVESAHVRCTYLDDVDGALDELIEAQEWEAAFELSSRAYFRLPPLGATGGISAGELYERVRTELVAAAVASTKDMKEAVFKLQERSARLEGIRETKARMRAALGTPGGGKRGSQEVGEEDDENSDAFSGSTGASSSAASSIASDVTFASTTASHASRTSLYASVGRGNSSRGRAARARRADKASRKRIRAGDAREEDALVATLRRLVPKDFARARVGRTLRALAHAQAAGVAQALQEAADAVVTQCRRLPEDVLDDEDVRRALSDSSWRMDIVRSLG